MAFFCELENEALQELFSDGLVVQQLKALNASVNLGILDFSPQRAEIVKLLNRNGISVEAWLLLTKEEGYWFNVSSVSYAWTCYLEFLDWTNKFDLTWSGVGLDIEPHIHELNCLFSTYWHLPWNAIKRLLNFKKFNQARVDYDALVVRIQSDGYLVNSYKIPFLLDERRSSSTFLQRILGVLDLQTNGEIIMLYGSYFRPKGPAVLWSYGLDANMIAVGVTGGGVEIEGMKEVPFMSWDELSQDLLLAHAHNPNIHIFSLEGCVRQGFLERLKTFNWELEISPPLDEARKVDRMRKVLQVCLRFRIYPIIVLIGMVGIYYMAFKWCHRK